MKKIIFTLFLFTSIDAYALPDCPDRSAIWNNCFGFSIMGNDGDTYEGEFKNNLRHGQGTYTWSDGRKFVGEFILGRFWNGIEYDISGKNNIKIIDGKIKIIKN